MYNLREYSDEEIIELVKNNKIEIKDFIDSGICPTCFDRENNNILYGNKDDKMLYQDGLFECFLVSNPRSNGHTVINTKMHYKDMLSINDLVCSEIFKLAKRVMIILKDVYKAESIYLCTMCDGPMNHFHIQLIPRYKEEPRGSKNFVKPRGEFIKDINKIEEIRRRLRKFN